MVLSLLNVSVKVVAVNVVTVKMLSTVDKFDVIRSLTDHHQPKL
jgi:hypothetical protein